MASTTNSNLNKYILLAEVRSGQDLPKGCYVKVLVENQEQKTTISKDADKPVWNEKMLFRFDHIPDQIEFRVKHERALLPNNIVGEYIIDIHSSSDQTLTKPIKLLDGFIKLDNAKEGKLDVKLSLHNIDELDGNQYEFKNENAPTAMQQDNITTRSLTGSTSKSSSRIETTKDASNLQTNNIGKNDSNNNVMREAMTSERQLNDLENKENHENMNMNMNNNDMNNNDMNNNNNNNYNDMNNNNNNNVNNVVSHRSQSPLQEQSNEYIIEQPVEIYRRIIHVEKPRIIEVPIYKEIHEYIREEPQYITQDANVIHEDLGVKNVSQLSEAELNRFKQYANNNNDNNNNMSSINNDNNNPEIIFEKEQIKLATEIRELPQQIHEKEVIYEQPIEIERRHIETIKPTVYEQVKYINEHVTMKVEPETKVADAVIIKEGDKYFTQDTKDTINNNNNNDNNVMTETLTDTTTTSSIPTKDNRRNDRNKLEEMPIV